MDFLSQSFREYIKKIFNLNDAQTANETEGMHSVRECVTAAGAPFWSLKYLAESDYGNSNMKEVACQIIDNIQVFIAQEGNIDEAMTNVLQLFVGRGKLRERMTKAFQDKAVMSKAFSAFLFEFSPELREITEKLSVHPESLRDKVFGVMQDAVYTWKEEDVKKRLNGVVSEYRYLDALNTAMRNTYHSHEEALRDLRNAFNHMRVAILAIEPLQMPWYETLTVLRRVSRFGIDKMTLEERESDIRVLAAYGKSAWECIQNVKPVLQTILEQMQLDCTQEELNSIYSGLKDVSCDATLTQFEKDLETQTNKISQERNRNILLERWKTLSSTETVKEWCNTRGIPLLWIVPDEVAKAISTLISVQKNERTLDQDVQSAIHTLDAMDHSLLLDIEKAEQELMTVIGEEYREIFTEKKKEALTALKLKLGNDISAWTAKSVITMQKTLKSYIKEKAKEEKLQSTQNHVRKMNEGELRDKVASFLSAHPEFCDDFS